MRAEPLNLNLRIKYQMEIRSPFGEYIFGSVITDLPIKRWCQIIGIKEFGFAYSVLHTEVAADDEFTKLEFISFFPEEENPVTCQDKFNDEVKRIAQLIAFHQNVSDEDPLLVISARIYLSDLDQQPTENRIAIKR